MKMVKTDTEVFVWRIDCERYVFSHYSLDGAVVRNWVNTWLHCVARSAQDAIDLLKAVDPNARIIRVEQRVIMGAYPGVLIDASVLPVETPAPPARETKPKRRKTTRRKNT